mgnify:CR=1 FL=1
MEQVETSIKSGSFQGVAWRIVAQIDVNSLRIRFKLGAFQGFFTPVWVLLISGS